MFGPRKSISGLLALGLVLSAASLAPAKQQDVPPQPTPTANDARQKAVAAQKEVARAQDAKQKVVSRLRTDFEKSADWQAVQKDIKDAQAALDEASKPVLEALAKNPDYDKAQEEAKAADAAFEELKNNSGDPQARLDARTKSMKLASALTKMKADAIAANPKCAELKTRIAEANKKMLAMRKQFDDSIKTNQEVVDAESAVKKAADDKAAADKDVTAAQTADQQAMVKWREEAQRIQKANADERRNNNNNNNNNNNGGKRG